MSREGANNRIDSLKNSLNHDHYQRTALGSAVRFNTMLSVLDDFADQAENNPDRVFTKKEFSSLMDNSVNSLIDEFDEFTEDDGSTPQQELQNRAYKTALGQTIAKATTQRKGLYQDFNTSYSSGATGAFRSFTNGFVQDDEDYFGSRVLYDNVFGSYEDGTESLSSRKRLAMSDPANDNRTVGEKVLDNVVNKSIYDQTEIIDRVDIEFGRFHGQSMIDQYSMTGSGLRSARQTIRTVMAEGSAYGRQVTARGESDDHPVTLAQALMDRTGQDIDSTRSALNLLNNNLGNRSSTTTHPDGGYVNKAGVAEFIDLINTAGSRDSNGSLTGGRISISSFQFQNETISAALSDKIQRHVLESVLQGGGAPLQIDLTLAYPRQRNLDNVQDQDGRYAVGQTNYGILGPNLVEALKLQKVKEDIQDMLKGLGVSPDQIENYVNLNIEFRDKKFHPKVYLTDNRASIGTQNLTAPVGTSVNQAGSNFETMRFVTNSFTNDQDLIQARFSFNSQNANQANSITQSLLYRQIVDSVNQEREYNNGAFTRSQGNTSTPILSNQQGSQVGFAGDIYQHLKNTLDFAHTTSFGNQLNNPLHMFMTLDQAFILQIGSNSYNQQLKGEMGNETGIPYSNKSRQAREYQKQQHKLFDLLITDRASVVVDTKNYKQQVLNPLMDKIYAKDVKGNYLNSTLISNFEKQGKSLNILSGFDLLRPVDNATKSQYDDSLSIMFRELRRLGFTKEAGFKESDLKQIIGLASGNIEMAKAPRQHAKEAALVQYSDRGPELISYYQGSSNMGLYSLGINSGKDGSYQKGDGDLTNTEMGIMLGRRNINSNLSRASSTVDMSQDFVSSNNILGQNIGLQQWILSEQEEEYELSLAQRHLSVTWNQLSQGTSIMDPKNKKNIGSPGWQDNVNTTDLAILKNRLEVMGRDLGLSSDAFKIEERYGNVSGKGVTSINVSIDLNKALNSGGFMEASTKLPKLNFELSVLQGPSRGNGLFSDSIDDGNTPGFVYFVDKNKVIGNGLFVNESGQNISVLGRKNYEDDFISDIKNGGRINLQTGQSGHMSSLDIVPQLFATLMGEAVGKFGAGASINSYNNLNATDKQNVLLDYVSNILSGRGSQIDESISKGTNIKSTLSQIKDNLNIVSLQDLNETISRHSRSLENRADSNSLQSRDPLEKRASNNELTESLKDFNNKWFHKLKSSNELFDTDVFNYISDLNTLAEKSPQLINMIMRTSYKDSSSSSKLQSFKDFQTLLFGSFLQTKDDRTYGGQQGFYRTSLMGLGSSDVDKNTASLMFDIDQEQSLQNLNAYARFKPLEYNPLTNIHDVLYRSVASKSTSLTKNDSELDSIFLESEARDLGDAANLRLMSSIGIGNVMHRDDFIKVTDDGNIELGNDQKVIFESMAKVLQASGSDLTALDKARESYLNSMQNEFGDLNSEDRKDTIRLNFYTGSAKKLSQLPQRIKNAMGARPMYQYSIDAQMVLERGESLTDLSSNYLQKYRDPLVSATKSKLIKLLDEREQLVKIHGEENIIVRNIDTQIDDLKVIGSKAFNSKVSGLGAVFSGRIKSVLNQEQISFITKTRERLENSIGDLINQGELSDEVLDELIRVEVLKAGLTNRGLGKMISGSDHMNYSVALIQLSGTYNDTFSANPLYGTVYESEGAYKNIRNNDIDIYNKNLDKDATGVYTLGMKEGHYETRRKSIKGSKMGEGGMQLLTQENDIVVQNKETGVFVHKRKVNGDWQIIGQADEKRNLATISNLIDNNSFSPVGSPSLASETETIYAREGQNSINYIYGVDSREGNFANNEYLLEVTSLTSQDPSSGQRVEGTDTSALIKGVAMFAGRIKYNSFVNQQLVTREMNLFENLEDQIIRSYEQGNLGGSLKSYLDFKNETQRVKLQEGREGYAPLSSSLHGLYNANNFKSFFWSHGATILKAQNEAGNKFMLDELFSVDNSQVNAKKLIGALVFNFGTSFIQETDGNSLTNLKRSLVNSAVKGEFGSHYQKLVMGHSQELASDFNIIFNNEEKRAGRSEGEVIQDLLFNKIAGQSGFNNMQLGAINILTSSQLQQALNGNQKASTDLLNLVRQGIIDPVSERAGRIGGINFNSSADKQAALITTAVDFMHQLSNKGSKMTIASDIDFDNRKTQEVLLNVIGQGHVTSDELIEDLMNFYSGVNSDITSLSIFADITFAYGKDPTGTQSIAKHEAQHLITPYLGDIQKYREGGKLSNLQHTVAELAALVTKTNSGLVFYDQMAKVGFNDKTAINLVDESSDYLFTSFNKQNYLGFYQSGMSRATTLDYVKEYEKVNKGLIKEEYDWQPIQTIRDVNDRTQFDSTDSSQLENSSNLPFYKKVEAYVNTYHHNASDNEKAALVDKYLMMGGDQFALHQLDELTNMMILENSRYQADPSKKMGSESTSQFLENMSNKQMFFSIPDVNFDMQNGEIVAKPNSNKLISTILPSAKDMQVLGAEYSGFVDPIISHYKALSSIFVPGTIANTVFEKIRLSARDNRAIILSTDEYKAFQGVLDAANLMPLELKKATAGARTQEAFAGKNKYQGFTATGIGNLLMPFGSVVASQTKLDQAGLDSNKDRLDLIRSSNEKIRDLENRITLISKRSILNEIKEPVNSLNELKKVEVNNYIIADPWLDNTSDSKNLNEEVLYNIKPNSNNKKSTKLVPIVGDTVIVGEDSFIFGIDNGWSYYTDRNGAASGNTDVAIAGNLYKNQNIVDALKSSLETSPDSKKVGIQKQIEMYQIRIDNAQKKLQIIDDAFQSKYKDRVVEEPVLSIEEIKPIENSLDAFKGMNLNSESSIKFDSEEDKNSFLSLNKNILQFYKKQRSAEAFGISSALQKDFNTMKLESIKTKNEILKRFVEIDALNENDKKAAFEALKEGIKQKRDIAYKMARINPETGENILSPKDFSEKFLSAEDRYIYHAQALNYDVLLTETILIGNEAKLVPLSKEVVKQLETKRKEITGIEFLLNSFEDAEGLGTFAGLGHKPSEISQDALFTRGVIADGEGMVDKHMKAIKSIGSSFKGLKIPKEAQDAKLQYALQQIESSIEMYKKRSGDMQAFNAEREVYSMQRDAEGKLIVEEAVQRKIDTASSDYNNNTREIIDFLTDQKNRLLTGQVNDVDIRNVFEDIDIKIAEQDRANLNLAEVFRPPTPGGTDPRLHTYNIMQGIQSLNKVSQMLSDTKQIGTEPKMIYSTERGQTATVLAALGVTTFGGGDFDGDSYTAIFAQMEPIQKAIQNYQSNVDSITVTLQNYNKKKLELESKVSSSARETEDDLKRIEDYENRIDAIKESINKKQSLLQSNTEELAQAKRTLEQQIQVGHNGLQSRARKQIANYMGIDEAFFVQKGEVMFDAYGNAMIDSDGNQRTGINMDKTYDADSMFVFMEQGYKLMEGIESSGGRAINLMNNIDVLLGHNSTPEAFKNGEFLDNLVNGIQTVEGKITDESPAIGLLKDRVAQLQNNTDNLTEEQKQFVNSLKDAPLEQYKAYLEQFNNLSSEMNKEIDIHNFQNQQLAEESRKDFSKRAFVNKWIGGNLYSAITSDATLAKFMTQGNGMTLTEGTFDMTLKTLGKAGGEVLGKTYNTIIGTTFQDAPIITYGRQMLEDGDLAQATKSEFTRQLEGDSEYIFQLRQEVKEEGIDVNDPRFNQRVKQKIEDQALNKFQEYQELTRAAVLKSEGTQGFMKNIHQLLRDSIKLKDGDGGLLGRLTEASETYDDLSKQIVANDTGEQDSTKRKELVDARDQIISGMASKLGPGPGLKSLIDLDYLTNESDALGLSKNDFEQRFLTQGSGGIESNRQMLLEYSYSMSNLSDQEKSQLRDPNTIGDESSALLKVARNMTAKNLMSVVSSFRMNATAVEGRGDQIKNFAASHKASLATKSITHSLSNVQTLKNRTEDGVIDTEDNAGLYIRSKYGLIEEETQAGNFDANRQHKNALGAHLGIEEHHMYNEDGSVSKAYIDSLKKASSKLNITNEEYTLMFDIHHEQSREQVEGLFGKDGEKMEQFTVMNMMRKDIARSMMDGRVPSSKSTGVLNDNIGSEVLTTMAQLAATGKLDSQGMDIFSGMYKGVMGHLLEATDAVVEYKDKGTGEMRSMQFSNMNQQQKSAYMTKLIYQNMIGTENNSSSGFNRSTSQEGKDWKMFNSNLIANSVLELDEHGRLGNEFIDALDKAGANSSTGQQVEMYEAMGEEYLRNSLDNDVQREAVLAQYLPNKGETGTKESAFYRDQMSKKVRAQIKYRQEQDSKKYATARSRHNLGHGVLQRSSFMNKINTSALNQLSTDTSANALDLFVPLALTMVGSAISEGSVDKDQLMQLGGATFTAFQYARTGTIDSTGMDPTQYKKRLASAQAIGGIFKFKNALAQQGDENVGMAVAQLAVQETTAIAFNAIATPWLSKQIAERGLGVKHAPALNSLDMKKYAASQQLAGNLGASVISAISSTLISGLLMNGVESMSQNLGDTIQSFMPAVNAVNAVNESISKRRQQEAAFEDIQTQTDDSEEQVKDYMVMTSSSYDSNNYMHMADLNEPQDIEPSMDGSLTVDLLS